jgi:hypothetical protein
VQRHPEKGEQPHLLESDNHLDEVILWDYVMMLRQADRQTDRQTDREL